MCLIDTKTLSERHTVRSEHTNVFDILVRNIRFTALINSVAFIARHKHVPSTFNQMQTDL